MVEIYCFMAQVKAIQSSKEKLYDSHEWRKIDHRHAVVHHILTE